MTQPSLTDFLLARLAEDEAVARAATGGDRTGNWWIEPDGGGEISCLDVQGFVTAVDVDGDHIARHDPARVLADVEAKRKIVELHEIAPVRRSTTTFVVVDGKRHDAYMDGGCFRCYGGEGCNSVTGEPGWCETLSALALPYADHPDYRAEWRP